MPSAIGRGEGSEIGQNCRRIVLKKCRLGGGGCQKSGKIADVVYGWFLCMAMYGWYPNLKLRNYWQNVSHISLHLKKEFTHVTLEHSEK